MQELRNHQMPESSEQAEPKIIVNRIITTTGKETYFTYIAMQNILGVIVQFLCGPLRVSTLLFLQISRNFQIKKT